MAFQGKGIFDGFSGKLGCLVGYKRNGKSIIQTIGNRTGNILRMIYEFVFQVLGHLNDAVSGEYFIRCTVQNVAFRSGGYTDSYMNSKDGGLEWEMLDDTNWGAMCLGSTINDIVWSNQQFMILHTNNRTRCYDSSGIIYDNVEMTAGYKFRILIEQGVVNFYSNFGTLVYTKIATTNDTPSYPLYGIASMQILDTEFAEIRFGGLDLKT